MEEEVGRVGLSSLNSSSTGLITCSKQCCSPWYLSQSIVITASFILGLQLGMANWSSWAVFFLKIIAYNLLISVSDRVRCTGHQSQGRLETRLPIASWYGTREGKHKAVKPWVGPCCAHTEEAAQGQLQLRALVLQGQWVSPVACAGQFYSYPAQAAVDAAVSPPSEDR